MYSGTVDAAVNGGIKNYESFITGTYVQSNPEIAEDITEHPHKKDLVQKLINVLNEQVRLVTIGLKLHRSKCLESMIPLHQHIEHTFEKMKTDLKSFGIVVKE